MPGVTLKATLLLSETSKSIAKKGFCCRKPLTYSQKCYVTLYYNCPYMSNVLYMGQSMYISSSKMNKYFFYQICSFYPILVIIENFKLIE